MKKTFQTVRSLLLILLAVALAAANRFENPRRSGE